MANEFTIRSYLNLNNGYINYRSASTGFNADQKKTNGTGPVPGGLIATTAGIDVSFAGLTQPGLCEITNQGTVTIVVGLKDVTTGVFYPYQDLLPGESYVIRLSQFLADGITGTGSHAGGDTVTIHIKALGTSCPCAVKAFEN